MNSLLERYGDEIAKILGKYPADRKRSAVMPLLYVAQRDKMYVSGQDMAEIGEILGLHATEVASIVGFYSLYYDKPAGKSRVQICTDLPCALRGADKFAADVCGALGVKLGGTTPDGKVTVEGVMCLAACDKAPMFQLQNGDGLSYHENQTVDGTVRLIHQLREVN
jgi:NADH-quinone oxidoreductase subunit E